MGLVAGKSRIKEEAVCIANRTYTYRALCQKVLPTSQWWDYLMALIYRFMMKVLHAW